jgi:hypothetical protein
LTQPRRASQAALQTLRERLADLPQATETDTYHAHFDRAWFLTLAHTGVRNVRPNLPDDDHVFVLHERSPTARTLQRRLASYGQQAGVAVSPQKTVGCSEA